MLLVRRLMYTLDWVEEVKLRYTSSESSIFILHGNIRDLYPWMDEDGNLCFLDIQVFLTKFLQRTKDFVLYFNLNEGLNVKLGIYNDYPIKIDLPNQIECKIKMTDAAIKGQTAASSYKPALLENGLNVQVPPFIENGDSIIVDTRTIEYVKKV